jgi:hypothetical protein
MVALFFHHACTTPDLACCLLSLSILVSSTLTAPSSSSHCRARTMPTSSAYRVVTPLSPHLPDLTVFPVVPQYPNLTRCCSCFSNLVRVCPLLYASTAASFPSCTCHTPTFPVVVYAFLPHHCDAPGFKLTLMTGKTC